MFAFAERRHLTLTEALNTPLSEIRAWCLYWEYLQNRPKGLDPRVEAMARLPNKKPRR